MPKRKLTPELAATEWLVLKAQMKSIEKKLGDLKAILEPALREAQGNSLEFHGWKFLLVEFTKESFSLSKAREKIDGRVLAPYVVSSEVTQIRTSWQGGEAADAA